MQTTVVDSTKDRGISMAHQAGSLALFCFGSFRFDLHAGSLEKNGVRLRLGGQPARVLGILAQRAGEVVTREELRSDLWDTDTFVDFEHGLNAAMNKLRQTLGDSADRPRFIETLPGRGYRFVAAVRIEGGAPDAQSPAEEQRAPESIAPPSVVSESRLVQDGRRRRPILLALIVTGALVVSIGVWIASSRRPFPPPLRPLQFTLYAPEEFAFVPAASRQSFAVSPDGSRLAFVALGVEGQFHLWVRELASLEPREVIGAKGVHTLFWSPRGDFLYFGLDRSLRRVSTEPGSAPQIIAELPRRVPPSGTWLSPERLLLSYRQMTVTVPPAGGHATAVPDTYLWPQMLPDGENLLYLAYDARINRFRLRAGRFGAPQSARDILETDSRVTWVASVRTPGTGYLLYVRSGSLLAQPFDPGRLQITGDAVSLAGNMHVFQPTGAADFSVSATGVLVYQPLVNRSHIAWVDRAGRERERVGPDNLSLVYVRASPDGRKVAASVHSLEKGGNEIWVYDTPSQVSRLFAPGPGILDSPVWAMDSKRLVYSRGLGSGPRLYMRGLGEEERELPLPASNFQIATDWSRDGRWVLFNSEGVTDGNLGVIDLTTRHLTWLLESLANEVGAAFSPDSRWIAFISNESGRPEVYAQAFEGGDRPRLFGDRVRLSSGGAQALRWRGDGKEICYLGMDGFIHSVTVRIGQRLEVDEPVALFRLPVASRAGLPSQFGFDLAPDGSRFLLPVARETAPSALVVIEDWESLVHRR